MSRRLAVADLDADRVDEDQPVELVAARDRDLGRQPAAERQPDQRDPLERQLVEQRQIEMHEIIDRVEIGRPLRVAEARRGRRDDLGLAAEQVEKPRVRMDRVHAVQQQHRASRPRRAAPQARSRLPSGARRPFRPSRPVARSASCHGRPICAAGHRRAIRRPACADRRRPAPARRARMSLSQSIACSRAASPIHYGASVQQQKGGDPVSIDQPRSTAAVTRIPASVEIRA